MAETLPRLRYSLDFAPSLDPARPGLVIRDPYHFSDAVLVVPPALVAVLDCFDGEHTELDLRSELVRLTGEIQVGDIERNLFDSLNDAGFLETAYPGVQFVQADKKASFGTIVKVMDALKLAGVKNLPAFTREGK